MDPIVGFFVKRVGKWWLRNRPFSKEKREYRKQRRAIKRKNRERKKLGQPPLKLPEKPQMDSILNLLGKFRTSTKAGIVGVLTYVFMTYVPFAGQAEEAIAEACQSPEGAITGLVTFGATFVAARLSKTPDKPGIL